MGLPIGYEGAYFVAGKDGEYGGNPEHGVIDHNSPPGSPSWTDTRTWQERQEEHERLIAEGKAQPGLWCQWTANDDGTAIVWDEGEKFYEYVPWLEYIVAHFLKPWGYSIEGSVDWSGEDDNDRGTIHASGDKIEAINDQIVKPKPSWASV